MKWLARRRKPKVQRSFGERIASRKFLLTLIGGAMLFKVGQYGNFTNLLVAFIAGEVVLDAANSWTASQAPAPLTTEVEE